MNLMADGLAQFFFRDAPIVATPGGVIGRLYGGVMG
jgi:hypothetical protein